MVIAAFRLRTAHPVSGRRRHRRPAATAAAVSRLHRLARRPGPRGSRALWAERLKGLDGPTLLSPALTATPPPAGMPRRTTLRLDRHATTALTEAARGRGVTLNTVVQMAWAKILSVFTDRSDVAFGVSVSGRPGELSGVETMVGMFIDTVPLRVRLDPRKTAGAQCVALQRESAALRDHSYLGHAELRSIAGVGEMFDTLLVYENFPPARWWGLLSSSQKGRPSVRWRSRVRVAFPRDHRCTPEHGCPHGVGGGARRCAGHDGARGPRQAAAGGGSAFGGQVGPPLREVDVARRRADSTSPEPVGGGRATVAVHTRFAEIAAAKPDSVAVSWADGQLTYRGARRTRRPAGRCPEPGGRG